MRTVLVSALLAMPLFWLCLCNNFFVVSGLCPDDQRSLLLQLKNNLTFTFESSTKLKLWNPSNDCCSWIGLSCDKEGHVTALDLSGESITGGFGNSSTLFSLQHLHILNLADNAFNSSIPSAFKRLQNLSYLNLSYAGFVGRVPIEISQLTRLVTLDLSSSWSPSMDNLEIPNLQKLVKNLISIRQLYLNGVSITASGHEWCGALIPLRDLQELSMSSCGLSGPLHPSLARLENLSVIVLDGNNLSSPVPEAFAHLKILTILRLSSCQLTGIFPEKIFNIGTLSVVDVSSNNNLQGFFPDFPPGSLQTLSVRRTSFSGAFPHSIGNLRNLSELDFSYCRFNGTLPNSLSNLTELSYLDLSHNNFTGRIPSFHMGKKLTYLDLSNNGLSGAIPSFEGLNNLVRNVFPENAFYLDLSNNKFNSFIPQNIGNYLSSAIFISLSNNYLRGHIPDSLCNASYLETLDLSNNNISGTIPSCLTELSYLGVLNLGKNSLMGPVPDMFSAACTLRTLDLHDNQLDGKIPKSLSNCTSLEQLKLGKNKIKDVFPCFLKNISTLRVFVLRENNLYGHLGCPNTNATFQVLQIVDLAVNNFSGELPQTFFTRWEVMMSEENKNESSVRISYEDSVTVTIKGQQRDLVNILTLFTLIDFSSNHFEGKIPEELFGFKALYALNLSNNAFSGQIPASIRNLKDLESLDLSNNSLEGNIPTELASLSFLSSLNVSSNRLVGKIPTGTQLQSFPASSFEGNEGLYGPPLSEKVDGREAGVLIERQTLVSAIEWNFISVEVGLIFGHGIIFGPLLFCKQWRIWYWHLINKILCWIFPQLYFEYETMRGPTYATLRWQH